MPTSTPLAPTAFGYFEIVTAVHVGLSLLAVEAGSWAPEGSLTRSRGHAQHSGGAWESLKAYSADGSSSEPLLIDLFPPRVNCFSPFRDVHRFLCSFGGCRFTPTSKDHHAVPELNPMSIVDLALLPLIVTVARIPVKAQVHTNGPFGSWAAKQRGSRESTVKSVTTCVLQICSGTALGRAQGFLRARWLHTIIALYLDPKSMQNSGLLGQV